MPTAFRSFCFRISLFVRYTHTARSERRPLRVRWLAFSIFRPHKFVSAGFSLFVCAVCAERRAMRAHLCRSENQLKLNSVFDVIGLIYIYIFGILGANRFSRLRFDKIESFCTHIFLYTYGLRYAPIAIRPTKYIHLLSIKCVFGIHRLDRKMMRWCRRDDYYYYNLLVHIVWNHKIISAALAGSVGINQTRTTNLFCYFFWQITASSLLKTVVGRFVCEPVNLVANVCAEKRWKKNVEHNSNELIWVGNGTNSNRTSIPIASNG